MNSYRRRRCGKYALQGAVQTHHYDVRSSDVDVTEYLRVNEEDIVGRLGEALGLYLCIKWYSTCLLYTSPSPRDRTRSRMPSSA